MNVIRTNRPNFFGNNGEPLQSGYIYIGQPNQDPIGFPKTVTFEDSQGNQTTAAQPLRTNAQGQVTFNGKAIIAFVTDTYSMLILDSTQTQIVDGYTPLVVPEGDSGSTSELTNYREYALTLADVKKLDKSPGQTVGNVGKISALDGFGANWLVVSATGNPANDIDLIDFDNALQGQRIDVYPTEDKFQAAPTHYDRIENSAVSTAFDVTALPDNTAETVGPTGSGADNIWAALDELPSDIKYIDVPSLIHITVGGGGTSAEVFYEVYGFHPDIAGGSYFNYTGHVAGFRTGGTDNEVIRSRLTMRIPVNSGKVFNLRHGLSGFTTETVLLYPPVGFGI